MHDFSYGRPFSFSPVWHSKAVSQCGSGARRARSLRGRATIMHHHHEVQCNVASRHLAKYIPNRLKTGNGFLRAMACTLHDNDMNLLVSRKGVIGCSVVHVSSTRVERRRRRRTRGGGGGGMINEDSSTSAAQRGSYPLADPQICMCGMMTLKGHCSCCFRLSSFGIGEKSKLCECDG